MARIGRDEIRATVAAELGCPADSVADDDDLIQLGLNSIRMMALAGGWRKRGAGITFAELAASPTVDSWHDLLCGDDADEGRARQPRSSQSPLDRLRRPPRNPVSVGSHAARLLDRPLR